MKQFLQYQYTAFKLQLNYHYNLQTLLFIILLLISSIIFRLSSNPHLLIIIAASLFTIKIIFDLLNRIIQSIDIVNMFNIWRKENPIKLVICFYYLQQSLFTLLSLWILYIILSKLSHFINPLLFTSISCFISLVFLHLKPLTTFTLHYTNKPYKIFIVLLLIITLYFVGISTIINLSLKYNDLILKTINLICKPLLPNNIHLDNDDYFTKVECVKYMRSHHDHNLVNIIDWDKYYHVTNYNDFPTIAFNNMLNIDSTSQHHLRDHIVIHGDRVNKFFYDWFLSIKQTSRYNNEITMCKGFLDKISDTMYYMFNLRIGVNTHIYKTDLFRPLDYHELPKLNGLTKINDTQIKDIMKSQGWSRLTNYDRFIKGDDISASPAQPKNSGKSTGLFSNYIFNTIDIPDLTIENLFYRINLSGDNLNYINPFYKPLAGIDIDENDFLITSRKDVNRITTHVVAEYITNRTWILKFTFIENDSPFNRLAYIIATYSYELFLPFDISTHKQLLLQLIEKKYNANFTKYIDTQKNNYNLFKIVEMYDDIKHCNTNTQHREQFNSWIMDKINANINNQHIAHKYFNPQDLLNRSRDELIFFNGYCAMIEEKDSVTLKHDISSLLSLKKRYLLNIKTKEDVLHFTLSTSRKTQVNDDRLILKLINLANN